ncbi:hypothetical protein [Microvirga sp. 17 mud 1-3]|uniref:hypothetical protein n=1 Tax=Microvirga sp. 17 mud 1-3 TaxID=2082949 RepID=UPI0013A57EEE|nr:hypothetical protein [Microvirga sp. 17 mud 1-3]
MCYYRQSSMTDAKAEAERRKETEAKRAETVDKLRQDAGKAAEKAEPVRESVPAK